MIVFLNVPVREQLQAYPKGQEVAHIATPNSALHKRSIFKDYLLLEREKVVSIIKKERRKLSSCSTVNFRSKKFYFKTIYN